MPIEIIVPDNVKSNYAGYNFIIGLITKYSSISNTEIVFNFRNVYFIEANLFAIIGTFFEILDSNNNSIRVTNFTNDVLTILRKNGFLVRFGYNKLIDNYDTSLQYKKFTSNDDIGFNSYIEHELLNKQDFPRHSTRLGKEIIKSIFEIYENARTHGRCDYIHTCGQFFPRQSDKPLHFTIVDKGVNIKQNVSLFLRRDIAAVEAIDWAMKKGNTTKTGDTSGGLGLGLIFEFITHNKGRVQVISSDGFYEYHNGIVSKKTLNSAFEGTIINICFNLNDNNHYRLVVEDKDDFENIF